MDNGSRKEQHSKPQYTTFCFSWLTKMIYPYAYKQSPIKQVIDNSM